VNAAGISAPKASQDAARPMKTVVIPATLPAMTVTEERRGKMSWNGGMAASNNPTSHRTPTAASGHPTAKAHAAGVPGSTV